MSLWISSLYKRVEWRGKNTILLQKRLPGSVKWGGGSRGSTEHIAAAMIAREVGVDPVKMLDKHNIPTRAISLMWNQRSVDTGLGWPYNVTSYGLLLTILGKMVNMIPEELIGNLGDTHIYSDHIDGLKEQLTREPYQLPTLKINSGNENWHLLELDEVLNTLDPSFTFKLENYQSHPTIKLPLSN